MLYILLRSIEMALGIGQTDWAKVCGDGFCGRGMCELTIRIQAAGLVANDSLDTSKMIGGSGDPAVPHCSR